MCRKRSNITFSYISRRSKRQRLAESESERMERLKKQRLSTAKRRSLETQSEREARKIINRIEARARLARETPAHRELRLNRDRSRARARRAKTQLKYKTLFQSCRDQAQYSEFYIETQVKDETSESSHLWRDLSQNAETQNAELQCKYQQLLLVRRYSDHLVTMPDHARPCKIETEEARERRLKANRLNRAKARSKETVEERKCRLKAEKLRQAKSRSLETEEQRELRLKKDRLRHAKARSLAKKIFRKKKTDF